MVGDEHFKATVEKDVFAMLCGDLLGNAASREVYDCAYDDQLVVKVENGAQSFQNILEWSLWNDAIHVPHAKIWLAPCVKISPCGVVLIQRKTTLAKKYPEKLPVWLSDTKRQNYGIIGGRFVCHDYGLNMVSNSGLSKRLKNVDWWDA